MSKKIESHNNQIKEGMKKIQDIIEKLSFKDGNEMAFLNQFIPNTFPFIFSELECQMQELKSKLSKLQLGFLIEKLNEKTINCPHKIDYEDLSKLKTGGNDELSTTKMKKLQEKILNELGQKTLDKIKDLNLTDIVSQRIMRWVLRGCNVELAFRKIKFDEEVYSKV